jgi:hypothetical protein
MGLAMSKQRLHRFHIERFGLKKLKKARGKGQYRDVISNRFEDCESLDAEVDTLEKLIGIK